MLLQSLVEAIVLSLVGGTIGIALGLGLSPRRDAVGGRPRCRSQRWPWRSCSPRVTGVFFGFYPARKAALDPIDALRFE